MADDKQDLTQDVKRQADAVVQDQKWAKETNMKDVDSADAQGGSTSGDAVPSQQLEKGGREL